MRAFRSLFALFMIIIDRGNKHLAKRYCANVIDYLIFLIAMGLIIFLLGERDDSGGYVLRGFKALLIPFMWFVYFPVWECVTGQTPGKKAFDLYVVDYTGESPSIGQTFQRRMLDPLELVFMGIPSLLTINHSEKNQRIGDIIAGTSVVSNQAICRFCGAALELSAKEAFKGLFRCPTCQAINEQNPTP